MKSRYIKKITQPEVFK